MKPVDQNDTRGEDRVKTNPEIAAHLPLENDPCRCERVVESFPIEGKGEPSGNCLIGRMELELVPAQPQAKTASSLEVRLSYLASRRCRIDAGDAVRMARRVLESQAGAPELARRLREECKGLPLRSDGVAGGCRVLGELAGLDPAQREAMWLILRDRPRERC